MLKQNCTHPIALFYTNYEPKYLAALKTITHKIYTLNPGLIRNQYFVPKEDADCNEKVLVMFENFIELCIEQKVTKEMETNNYKPVDNRATMDFNEFEGISIQYNCQVCY